MHTIYASGQNREMWFLTEDGLYEVLMQSRKPIAKEFKKQVIKILDDLRFKDRIEKNVTSRGEFQSFKHERFGGLRVTLVNQEIWFVLKDICRIVGVEDSDFWKLRRNLDENGIIKHAVEGKNDTYYFWMCNKSNLFSHILNKKRFVTVKEWINSEIIPTMEGEDIKPISNLVEFNVQNNNGILVVDSRIVADMVDKRHNNLVRDIENYIEILKNSQNSKLSFDNFFIESCYNSGTGKNYKNYLLTRKGCEFVANKMTGQKGTIFTATYIDKFHEIEQQLTTQFKVPTTMKEALLLAIKQEEKIEEQNKKIEHLTPHADFSKSFLKSEGTIRVGSLAKHLQNMGIKNIGQNRLFKWLRDFNYIFMEEGYNVPTQKSINMGIMELDEKVFRDRKGNLRDGRLTKVTPKGMAYFYKKFSKKGECVFR